MGEIRDLGGLLQRAGLALPVADGVPLTILLPLPVLMQTLQDEYTKSLRAIIQHIQSTGAKVVAITPPPVNAAGWKAFMQAKDASRQGDRDNTVTGQYANAAKSVAAELGCGAVDLWASMQEARPESGWHAFLSDGLHLTAAGNQFVFEKLVETIDATHADLKVAPCKYSGAINSGSSSALKQRFPWHDEITVDTDLDAAVVP